MHDRPVRELWRSFDLQAEKLARLAAELLVAAAQSAQRVERALAESPAHLRQVLVTCACVSPNSCASCA